ncbi:hypothetical protein OC188_02815 [Anaplasma capra]|nr:hypothetical protein [Anaplasma capra]MCU7611624.1 hypothetical protein [Anaplasma capra]MCU7612228.1 hypothetical protein [Anaplasma capra]
MKEVSLSFVDAVRDSGSGLFPVESVSYEDFEVKVTAPNQITLRNFEVKVGGASIVAESLLLSYNPFKNTLGFALPNGTVRVFGLQEMEEDATGVVECRTGASYSAVFHGNLLTHMFRKLILGEAVKNGVAEFTYADDRGVACFDQASSEYVPLYDQAYLSVEEKGLVSGEQGSIVTVNSEFSRNKNADGVGEVFFQVKDFSLLQRPGSTSAEGKTLDVSIPSMELRSDDFGLSVRGSAFLSESCMVAFPAKCKSDLNFELKGFTKFSRFISELVQAQAKKDNKAKVHMANDYITVFEAVISALKSATPLTEDGSDILTFAVKSDGKSLTIGNMPFLEFSKLLAEKIKGRTEGTTEDALNQISP